MHKAPLSERLDFVRYKSAEMHFAYAMASIDLALENARHASPMFNAEVVWTAFFINYAKPFKQVRSKTLGYGLRITDEIVPEKYRESHQHIIDLRNKYFAHTDLDFASNPLEAANEERIVVIAMPGGFVYGTSSIVPAMSTIEEYKETLEVLMKRTSYRCSKIMKRWARGLKLEPNSSWVVSLAKDSDDVLKPISLDD